MKNELLYLHHIRERCERVGGCVSMGRDEADLLGATGAYAGAAWRQIAGLRDVPIHDYPNLDLERVWRLCFDGPSRSEDWGTGS
jgi:hypothetical protein